MANFPTHVSTSIALGVGYGAIGHLYYGMPLPSSALAAGLVAIGGILPDIDSDNAVVLRESLTLVAAVTPLLAMDRLHGMNWPQETIVLTAAAMYLGIRFGLGAILRRFTVHRGMWHSIPAAAIAGIIVYFLAASPYTQIRLFKAGAMVLGFVWHLLLDEIYAVEPRLGHVRLKKSFGTAFKFWGTSPIANLCTYGLLIAATFALSQDPTRGQPYLRGLSPPGATISPLPPPVSDFLNQR